MNLGAALEAVERRLPNMRVVVGLGLHRPMRPEELAPIARWRPVQHDPDDVVATCEVDGIPGEISRHVAEAPWSLSIGVVELHQYAGFSGGHKGVAVGCGGRATLAALHHRDRVVAPGVEVGRVEGNPFRAAVDDLGEAAGCRLALVELPALGLWLCGEPRAVLREAAARLDPFERVARVAPGAWLSVSGPKAASFYQASRALTYVALSPRPPVAQGAPLVLHAPCSEGLGSEGGFVLALTSCDPPWTELLTGPAPKGAGAQRAVMLAMAAQRHPLRVVGCATASVLRAAGIDATEAEEEPPEGWLVVDQPFQKLPQLA
jgi:hypothetical protein